MMMILKLGVLMMMRELPIVETSHFRFDVLEEDLIESTVDAAYLSVPKVTF